MKKCIVILFIICIFSCASAENSIEFCGIPWLSDDVVSLQTLQSHGLVRNTTIPVFSKDNIVYIVENNMGALIPSSLEGKEDVVFSLDLKDCIKGRIAGYPVKDLILVFAYDGEYKLISIKIELIHGEYHDIKEKLIRKYGKEEKIVIEEGIETNIWKDNNGAAVVLYTQSDGIDFSILYGRVDTNVILEQCLQMDSEDINGL